MFKKVVISLVLTVLSVGAMNAQNLGVRLGYGAELSYQHMLGSNRLELGLGLSDFGGALNLTGTYQWVNPLVDNFNWYIGFGAGVGLWDKSAALAGLGQLGIEYNFSFPLQLSIDWRPGVSLVFSDGVDAGFWSTSVGFGIRYRF